LIKTKVRGLFYFIAHNNYIKDLLIGLTDIVVGSSLTDESKMILIIYLTGNEFN